MKIFLSLFIILSGIIMCDISLGFSGTHDTLHVYLRNNSRLNFYFMGPLQSNPGNYFSAEPSIVHPGETMKITAEKFLNTDIAANLSFKTSDGSESFFFILDQEQIHAGQPVFDFHGENNSSQLISKKNNENTGPRYLTYVEAVLQILDKT